MKAEILQQIESGNIEVKDFDNDDIIMEQDCDWLLIERNRIPDLIKILQSFVVMLLLSVSVFGQTEKIKPDSSSARLYSIGDITQWSTVGKWDNSITWSQNQSDTVAVYMLTTFKYANGMVPVRQTKGYSVTPRMAYNSSPRATYLDIDKKPLQDIYIVWMSVPRKEECTCK